MLKLKLEKEELVNLSDDTKFLGSEETPAVGGGNMLTFSCFDDCGGRFTIGCSLTCEER